jgi:hydrogenase nickel incorporation protein HypA/HybF
MMHELTVCQALVSQVEHIARDRAARVLHVLIGLGPLSGVEPRLLEDVYPLACTGTLAECSQLTVKEIDIRVRCSACGAETVAKPNRLVCGACGDWHTELLTGNEMLLLRVELETSDEAEVTDE